MGTAYPAAASQHYPASAYHWDLAAGRGTEARHSGLEAEGSLAGSPVVVALAGSHGRQLQFHISRSIDG